MKNLLLSLTLSCGFVEQQNFSKIRRLHQGNEQESLCRDRVLRRENFTRHIGEQPVTAHSLIRHQPGGTAIDEVNTIIGRRSQSRFEICQASSRQRHGTHSMIQKTPSKASCGSRLKAANRRRRTATNNHTREKKQRSPRSDRAKTAAPAPYRVSSNLVYRKPVKTATTKTPAPTVDFHLSPPRDSGAGVSPPPERRSRGWFGLARGSPAPAPAQEWTGSELMELDV